MCRSFIGDVAIKKRASIQCAKDGNGRLPLLGLYRPRARSSVHSHITHLYVLLEVAKAAGVSRAYVRFIGDGCDAAPRSAAGYCAALLDFMKDEEYGALATVVGRCYATDRNKRWEHVKTAFDPLVSAVAAINKSYDADVTDEFLTPTVNGAEGCIKGARRRPNYRSDRMRNLILVFGLPDEPMEVAVPTGLHITTTSRYNEFPFPVDAFPPQVMTNVLAERRVARDLDGRTWFSAADLVLGANWVFIRHWMYF
ncbi:BPG-independent [Mycena pura]|uniref:phosphoglycerate mutase (2,3-diphosphoglycerate-independent) n=1 Tax=Mycena pura TaxID=153505 RepID=A0AAD6V846_9AGAR|nr:BPG-independent [Mycena pura]